MVSSQPFQDKTSELEESESTDFSTPKIRFKKDEKEEGEKEEESSNNFLSGKSIVVKKI